MPLSLREPRLLRQAMLVDGQWIQADSGETEIGNPSSGQLVARVPNGGTSVSFCFQNGIFGLHDATFCLVVSLFRSPARQMPRPCVSARLHLSAAVHDALAERLSTSELFIDRYLIAVPEDVAGRGNEMCIHE